MFYAKMFARDVLEAIERLESFPLSVRMLPELKNNCIKELILGNDRIIYQVENDTAHILAVYHSSRLLSLDKIKCNDSDES